MMQLATLHHIVRAQVRARGELALRADVPDPSPTLSTAERGALLAWQRLDLLRVGGRPRPLVGSDEWIAAPPKDR